MASNGRFRSTLLSKLNAIMVNSFIMVLFATPSFLHARNSTFLGIICPFGDQPYVLLLECALTPDSSRKMTWWAFQSTSLWNQASRSSGDLCAAFFANYNQRNLQKSYLSMRKRKFFNIAYTRLFVRSKCCEFRWYICSTVHQEPL
jgi:hypothetical protein